MKQLKPKIVSGRRTSVYAYNVLTGKKIWSNSVASFCRLHGGTPSVIRRLLHTEHPFMLSGWIFSYGTPTIISGLMRKGNAGWVRLTKQWCDHYSVPYRSKRLYTNK